METRARYLLTGSFVLAFVTGIFLFIIWISRVQLNEELAQYRIFFSESVSGIGVGSDVRFSGIKVGRVSHIDFDPDDPRRVEVTIEIIADTPVREDSYAMLQLQGITGLSYVQIIGGTPESAMLPKVSSGEIPAIQAQESKISELVKSAPDLISQTSAVVNRAGQVLSQENAENISLVLADLRKVSSAIAAREQAIGRFIDSLDRTAQSMEEFELAVADGRKAAASIAKLADDLQKTVSASRGPIEDFAVDGLSEFRQFIVEARIMASNLSRLSARLESTPEGVLYGLKSPEFKGTPGATPATK
jgi:phospholipid/cholesterol/gamma-HCH transport system substrate-binding protein